MNKKYFDTKPNTVEQSVLGVWRNAVDEAESRKLDGRTKGYKEHRTKLEAQRARLKKEDVEEVDSEPGVVGLFLDEGYLELEFKDKQTAEKAYNYINNKIWAGGNPPYDDFSQEGNLLQIDTDANLNRRNQLLKDLKALPENWKFKVVANEEVEIEEELSPEQIAAEKQKAKDQFNSDMAKEFPAAKFTARAFTAPLGGGIVFEFAVIPTKDAKGVDLRNAPAHSIYIMHLTDNRNNRIPMSKFSIASIMGKTPVKFRKIIGKSPTDAVKKMVDWFKKNKSDFEGLVKEEVELDEAKNYEIKNGKIHISKANFRKVHKDYKNSTKGKERMMALDPKSGATTSFEVVFEEVELDEEVKVGDNVHLGFGAKGGAGFKGKVIKIDGNNVHIKNPKGKEYKGPMKFVTKEEVELDEATPDYVEINKSNVIQEAQSGDKEAYQKFFNSVLKKFKVKSPAELDDAKKKEFFNYVDKNWKGSDEKAEKFIRNIKKESTNKTFKQMWEEGLDARTREYKNHRTKLETKRLRHEKVQSEQEKDDKAKKGVNIKVDPVIKDTRKY
tara:strand:- start:879 stop:2543 length:1665 start_codon:yes stop_codon:yes gene_type:complete